MKSSRRFIAGRLAGLMVLLSMTIVGAGAHSIGSSGGGHSGGSSHSSGSYHSSGHYSGGGGYGRGYGNNYGSNYGYGNSASTNYNGLPYGYDPGHPVQTGASFSGPAHIDASQYHYFVQEYSWPTTPASTVQEPRNAVGTTYGVQSEPHASGLNLK